MKFKRLNEAFTSDDLYQKLIDYIYGELEYAVDNLAIKAASDVEGYDADYCSEEPNQSSMTAYNKLRQAAEFFAEFLVKNAPEEIEEAINDFYKEEPTEEFDASAFIGKPLKDFLRTIDHRTKINISSDTGYDSNGGTGNISGMSGLAHDAGWYLADKKITDIKVPQDKRFYDYSIFIESLDECDKSEDEIEEGCHKEEIKEEFEIGQKVKYNGKETFIKDIENDPKYGIDLLIKNPDWDGQDKRYEYIWVADKVEVI